MNRKVKICFASSSGGHWEELICLKEIADDYETFYVTEQGGQASDSNLKPIYVFPQINRQEKNFFPHFIKLFFNAWKIVRKEKPQFIITTGALFSVPFCVWCKIYGAKVIYIESFARVDSASLTGKIVYKFADLFLVQWEDMVKVYPKAKYVGGIF